MSDVNVMTPAGLQALREQLAQLEGEARREIAERIRVARQWGDLKENAEYHDAKNDQALLETKIARLQEKLRGARVTEVEVDSGVVAFGSTVRFVEIDSGREQTYTLVSSHEADVTQGRLSIESPVAQALLGARAEQEVSAGTPRGRRTLRVLAIS